MIRLDQRFTVRFSELEHRMDARFAESERRTDARFDRVETRLDRLEDRMGRQFVWTIGILLTILATIVGGFVSAS